jgi:hypothetical protein
MLVQTRVAQELSRVALAQSVVTIREETMALTRVRIAKMRVGRRVRMLMAWARMESEEAVAKLRKGGVACKKEVETPQGLRVVCGRSDVLGRVGGCTLLAPLLTLLDCAGLHSSLPRPHPIFTWLSALS